MGSFLFSRRVISGRESSLKLHLKGNRDRPAVMAGTLKQGAKAPTKAASIAASIKAAPQDADFDDLFYEAVKEENNMLRDHFNEEQTKATVLNEKLKNAEGEITFWKTKYDADIGKNEKELEQYKKTLQRKVPRKISEEGGDEG